MLLKLSPFGPRASALALGLAVALAGCGGGGAATTSTAASVARTTPAVAPAAIREAAIAYRGALRHGGLVARIEFARAGTDATVLAGMDQETVDRGPGWYERTGLPGEGHLIYLAGHRTTHGGPFGAVARLRRGDLVTLTTPYAVATYRVSERRRSSERDLSVLRDRGRELLRLQTSTLPASRERVIVDALPQSIVPR